MNNNVIAEFIDKLLVGKPLNYKNLTIFPVSKKIIEDEEKNYYMTLQEALTYRSAYVYETGKMEELKIVNNSNDEIFIMAGETLLGGGQNRIVNLPLNVKQNTISQIQTNCIEINRWDVPANFSEENAITFNNSDISPISLKSFTTREIINNYLNENLIKVNQQRVWSFIAEYLKKGKVKSHTIDINDIFKTYKGEIEDFCSAILIQKNQVGCITAINNVICCVELFSNKNIFRKMYPLLLKSYAIDAILNPVENYACKLDITKAQHFLKSLKTSKITNYKLSNDNRILFIQSPKIYGISLVNEDKLIFLTSFLSNT